MLMNNKDKNI